MKIANDCELVEFIENEIAKGKKSPYVVAERIKHKDKYKTKICFKTIYNYIDQRLFPTITNKDLLVKKMVRNENIIT